MFQQNSIMKNSITRRSMLRATGAAVFLPTLEGLSAPAVASSSAGKPPLRVVFLSFPYGLTKKWYPTEPGAGNHLTKNIEPLRKHANDFSVLTNLSNKLNNGAHEACDHWLTCADMSGLVKPFSLDQALAAHLGRDTRLSSIELSSRKEGGMGKAHSLAWSREGNSIPAETSPSRLYNRLFGTGEVPVDEQRFRLAQGKSILDAVMHDARSIQPKLSTRDREKLDQYFTSVRDVEQRMKRSEEWIDRPKPKAPFADPKGEFRVPGIKQRLQGKDFVHIMMDLMVAAFQADQTRVFTMRMPGVGVMTENGHPKDGHGASHFDGPWNDARQQGYARMIAYLIDKMKAVKEADGSTLFDNSIIVFGSSIRAQHKLVNTPCLVAGHGGGGMKQGMHYQFESKQTALANLWLSILQHAGVKTDRFADSEGPITGLFG